MIHKRLQYLMDGQKGGRQIIRGFWSMFETFFYANVGWTGEGRDSAGHFAYEQGITDCEWGV